MPMNKDVIIDMLESAHWKIIIRLYLHIVKGSH